MTANLLIEVRGFESKRDARETMQALTSKELTFNEVCNVDDVKMSVVEVEEVSE